MTMNLKDMKRLARKSAKKLKNDELSQKEINTYHELRYNIRLKHNALKPK